MSGAYILVVDDEPDIRTLLGDVLEDEGYSVAAAGSVAEARSARRARRPDLALLDVWLPDGDGIALLKSWTEEEDFVAETGFPVVMISGHGNVETAVEATRLGAFDFLEKPLSIDKLLITVKNALDGARLRRENLGLRRAAATVVEPVGSSAALVALREQVLRVAQHDAAVLMTGEAGVGKETFARYLHAHSARADGPFIVVPIGGLSTAEAATELFGAEQGEKIQFGLLEQAVGGVLFINEVAELDLATQARLLHALESSRVTRIGGADPIALNVRVIAATQVDLDAEVAAGRFREELFYRLNVLPLRVPPLREHAEDVRELLEFYVEQLHRQEALPVRRFDRAALDYLRRYHWPGNVRELKNFAQRLMILGQGETITREEVERVLMGRPSPEVVAEESSLFLDLPLREAREQFERAYLLHQLERTEGNMTKLADLVGLERTHLYRKFKTLNIDQKKVKDGE
ncbi:MAG: sigma-54-dependent transcriptional regulator [Thioalkalivibrionaceae bacterium]